MDYYPGYNLHKIGPYIGKLRPLLVRHLIEEYSKPFQMVWDPFFGSGTVPLECILLNRSFIGSEINPYAISLTKAKLYYPKTEHSVFGHLDEIERNVKTNRKNISLSNVPDWVKMFFHKKTLKEIIILFEIFRKKRLYFLSGCLLGILHHQRPGFLSFPSSNLVPYLRDKKFPRDLYPDAYEYRDPFPRIRSKIERMLKMPPKIKNTSFKLYHNTATSYRPKKDSIDLVITSPPYMDALDYARDNRLRMWFLGIDDFKSVQKREIGRITSYEEDMKVILKNISVSLKYKGSLVVVIGDIQKGDRSYDLAEMIKVFSSSNGSDMVLESQREEVIPNKKRSRKEGNATKKESILVFKKTRR